jgi:hypothetical protein
MRPKQKKPPGKERKTMRIKPTRDIQQHKSSKKTYRPDETWKKPE